MSINILNTYGRMSVIECYFSPTAANTVVDQSVGEKGSTMYETMYGRVYCDSGLTNSIGRIAISQTIFDILDSDNTGTYDSTGQGTLFLPSGNLTYAIAAQTVKTSSGMFVFPSSTYTFMITSGTGGYLSMSGTITITSNNDTTMVRKMTICLVAPSAVYSY
jgi:hypothetical protein